MDHGGPSALRPWVTAGNYIFMPGAQHPSATRPPSRTPPKSDASGKARWRCSRLPLILKWVKPGSGCALPGKTRPNIPASPWRSFSQPPLSPESQARPEVNLSWQEIYCLVSPHETLLQALSASYPSMESYYQGILEAAAAIGINAPEVLLSLLWHAPRGNARQHPEIWDYLQRLVAASPQTSPPLRLLRGMSLGNCSWIMPWLWQENLHPTLWARPRFNRGRRVPSRDVWPNRLNPGRRFGPPFPVARPGKI